MLLGALLCVACVTGVILEVRKQGLARALNVGIPATLTALMASSLFWLPILAKLQHSEYPSEAAEGAVFLLLLAGIPLCLAIITFLMYWLVDIEPNRTVTQLGLK
jgi:hypothetical protein